MTECRGRSRRESLAARAVELLARLAAGDRRTTGAADEVAAEIAHEPKLFAAVFGGLRGGDANLRMRCADALEKATRDNPTLLAPYKAALLGEIAASGQQEVRWHVAQMISRLGMNARERTRAFVTMERYLATAKSAIVRVNALQAIADLGARDASLREAADRHIAEALKDRMPSLRARARKLV